MDWNAYVEAWTRHDGEALGSFFTDDAVFVDNTLGAEVRGRDAIKGFVKQTEDEVSTDFRFTLLDHFEAGDRFALTWTFSGTNDRPSPNPPLPATGKTFSIRGVSIGRLEGGRIKENTDTWNMVEYLAQVGLMPAPAGAGG